MEVKRNLLAQIEITYEDGEVAVIATDDTFSWTQDGPIRFADNKDGEIYDARREDFAKAVWKKAKVTSHMIWPTASTIFHDRAGRLMNPKLIVTPSGKKVLDFGQNIAGILAFTVKNAKAGQRIFLRLGN